MVAAVVPQELTQEATIVVLRAEESSRGYCRTGGKNIVIGAEGLLSYGRKKYCRTGGSPARVKAPSHLIFRPRRVLFKRLSILINVNGNASLNLPPPAISRKIGLEVIKFMRG